MRIEYQKHGKRKKQAVTFWLQVAEDYNNGMTAEQIAKKYKNPLTSKNYTRAHIYWILARLNAGI